MDTTLESYRKVTAEFIITELDLASTFCQLASSADNLVRADRRISSAKRALQAALSAEKRVALHLREKEIIDEKIFHVESLLAELTRNSGSEVLSVP